MAGWGFSSLVNRPPSRSRTGEQFPLSHGGSHAHTRKLQILLADGNRIIQRVIARTLERAGHEVAIVEDDEQTLDALEDALFDLALIDIDFPVINGIDATKLYRFISLGQKRVPIVGLTANAMPEAANRCAEAAMDACLAKPVQAGQLLAVIRQLVFEQDSRPHPVPIAPEQGRFAFALPPSDQSDPSSFRSVFASLRKAVLNPSVNQPQTGASNSSAWLRLP